MSEEVQRDYRERNHEDKICGALDFLDLQYERQKRVATGIIDVFVYEKVPWIIEVKRSANVPNLMQAIVQLKFYESCFKSAMLYITTPEDIDKKYYPLLEKFGVLPLDCVVMAHNPDQAGEYIKTHRPIPELLEVSLPQEGAL